MMMPLVRKRNVKALSLLLVSAALLAFGSFSGCQSAGSAWSSGGGKSVSSAAASGVSAAQSSGKTGSPAASGTASAQASAASDSASADSNTSLYAVLSALMLQATGNTYYAKTDPSTNKCTSVTLSYENGKYTSVFPKKYDSLLYNDGEGPFYVSPKKTAAVINRNNTLVVVYSNDRGKTWKESTPILPSEIPFRNHYMGYNTSTTDDILQYGIREVDIDFPTDDCGYLFLPGITTMNVQHDRVLFKTTDGGKTWRFVQPPLKVDSAGNWIDPKTYADHTKTPDYIVTSADDTYNITFTSTKIGFLSGTANPNGILPFFRTTDGGITCTRIYLPQIPREMIGNDLLAPFFKSGKGYLPNLYDDGKNITVYYYASTDGGITWKYDPSMDNSYKKYLKK